MKNLIIAILLLAVMPAMAGPVDATKAQATAHRFMIRNGFGNRIAGTAIKDIKLLYTESNSTKKNLPVYHIFNSDVGFVIVSGDDRTQEILAYGNAPLAIGDIPDNMKFWLDYYKKQIEYLQFHPDAVVHKPKNKVKRDESPLRTLSIGPLVSAMWSQDEPYNNLCPVFPIWNDMRGLTGCAATSLSMLFHHWKYPTDSIPRIEAYSYWANGYTIEISPLPSVKFDWDNMLDVYSDSNYTTDQAIAVALLMRHVGQAEKMKYSKNGSSADNEDIMRAINFFGYGEHAKHVVKATTDQYGYGEELISDQDWAFMIHQELSLARPILYLAYSRPYPQLPISGHAFVVDGYNAATNTYHVNWGWNGKCNGYFALNAFEGNAYGKLTTYDIGQSMIIGIEPPATSPVIKAVPQVDVASYIGQTSSSAFIIEGQLLEDYVTLTLNDPDNVFSLDAASISAAEAIEGKMINVNYSPMDIADHTATVTLSSRGADDVVVILNGTTLLEVSKPVMLPADSSCITKTQFRADWTDKSAANLVTSYTLEVSQEPSNMLMLEADFSNYPDIIGNLASEAEQYLPDGLIFDGGGFWLDGGCIELCPGSVLTSRGYDFSAFGKVTVIVSAKSWSPYTKADITISTGLSSKVFKMSMEYATYTAVLDCNDLDSIRFTAGYYPMIQKIMIIGGELDDGQLRGGSEEGDANYRLIEGITDKSYTVKGLASGGTFYYKVKAHYVNGKESPWSLAQRVTLLSSGGDSASGDVNGDGQVNISDVTALMNYLLTEDVSLIIPDNADVNGDGTVNISDVTSLISLLLLGN